MTVAVSLKDVRKSYSVGPLLGWLTGKPRTFFALDAVSLDIEEGHTVGIVGENGAGKSTLLKVIAGVTNATSGVVDVRGRVHAALTLGVGMREELTGRENLKLDSELQADASEMTAVRLDEMIAFAELDAYIDQPVRTYSSGMKSRLSFTSLVFVEPEILLIDETLSAGDQWFQKKAKAAIHALCARGKIVIVVSHSLEAIQDMCDRCIWLRNGKVAADGLPSDVIPLYAEYQKSRSDKLLLDQRFAQKTAENASAVIGDISVFQGGELAEVLVEGQSAKILIELAPTAPLQSPALRLKFVRPDGLQVAVNESVYAEASSLVAGRYRIEVDVDNIILAAGFYLLQVELIVAGRVSASKSMAVKVVSAGNPTGGKPVLMPPINIRLREDMHAKFES